MNKARIYFNKMTRSVLCVESGPNVEEIPLVRHSDASGNPIELEVVTLEIEDNYKRAKKLLDDLEVDTGKKIKWKDLVPPGQKKKIKELKRETVDEEN